MSLQDNKKLDSVDNPGKYHECIYRSIRQSYNVYEISQEEYEDFLGKVTYVNVLQSLVIQKQNEQQHIKLCQFMKQIFREVVKQCIAIVNVILHQTGYVSTIK